MGASGAYGGQGGRILLVDDDPAYSEYVRRVLSSGGFDVGHQPDAESALARVHTEQWDLLITDIELPGMNGLELLERVHELVPGLPVAMLTGHASVDYAVSALRAAAAEFLQKPVSRPDLLAKAAELIAAGRAARGKHREAAGDEGVSLPRQRDTADPHARSPIDPLARIPDEGARAAPPG
jgi:two-component system, NtrC family, response regulator HydG